MSDFPRPPFANSAAVQSQTNWNYETTVARIEAIIEQVESGELDLAEIFDQFAAAVEYLQQCETFLADRQQQMNLSIEALDDRSLEF